MKIYSKSKSYSPWTFACVLLKARPFIVQIDLCRQTRQLRPFWFDIPHSQKLGLFSRGWSFRLHLQAVNMSNGDHGSSNIPGQTHKGAYDHQNGHPEQIQMISSTFLWRETDSLQLHYSKYLRNGQGSGLGAEAYQTSSVSFYSIFWPTEIVLRNSRVGRIAP